MEVMETIKDFPDTGNIVFDYLFTALMLFLQAYLWCVDKILKYPVVTAIFLIVVLILAIINRTIVTEIRGNLWKWRKQEHKIDSYYTTFAVSQNVAAKLLRQTAVKVQAYIWFDNFLDMKTYYFENISILRETNHIHDLIKLHYRAESYTGGICNYTLAKPIEQRLLTTLAFPLVIKGTGDVTKEVSYIAMPLFLSSTTAIAIYYKLFLTDRIFELYAIKQRVVTVFLSITTTNPLPVLLKLTFFCFHQKFHQHNFQLI